jgi:ligand-binding sensor domain-containing protein
MKRIASPFGALCIATLLSLALAGCPTQASYKATITPIYAATDSGLCVYNGSSWTTLTTTNGLASNTVNSVVVSGSGSGADVFVGTARGVSYTNTNGSSWTNWTTSDGLGAAPTNRLFLGSNILAATNGGVSTYNSDGKPTLWTTETSVSPAKDVFAYGTYTYIVNASGSSLYVYNGTSLENTFSTGTILAGSSAVNRVIVDSSLDIIAGTDTGLAALYYNKGALTSSGNLLGSPVAVSDVFLDSNGYLYAATANGLYRYISGSGASLLFSGTPVLCVYVDGAGTIYAGTSAGLKISTDGGASWTTQIPTCKVNCVVTTAPLYSF